MKKKYLLLLLLLLIPIKVKAITGSYYLDCDFNSTKTNITCYVYLNISGENCSGIQAAYSFGEGLSYSGFNVGSGWENHGSNSSAFVLTTADTGIGISGSGINPISFTMNASSSYNTFTIGLKNVQITNTNGDPPVYIYGSSKTLTRPTTTTTTTTTTKSPEPTTASYELYMKENSTTKTPNIIFGINTTKAPGTTTTFPTLGDNTLNDLKIEGYSINFLKNLYTYNIVIPKDLTSITINYELTNPTYRVIVSGVNNLKIGANKATVTIIDNNANTKVYTINVYRGNTILNSDASLKKLVIGDYKLNFYNDVYEYDLVVRNDDSLKVSATPNAATTTYQVSGNEGLSDGAVITVTTIAQDNSSKEYKVTIHYAIKTIDPYIVYVPLLIILGLALHYWVIRRHRRSKANKEMQITPKETEIA